MSTEVSQEQTQQQNSDVADGLNLIETGATEEYNDGMFTGAMLVAGCMGGAIVGILPVIGYGAGAMGFQMALLWQVGFIAMAVTMAITFAVVRDED